MKKVFAFCAGLLAVLNQTAVTALAAVQLNRPEVLGLRGGFRLSFHPYYKNTAAQLCGGIF